MDPRVWRARIDQDEFVQAGPFAAKLLLESLAVRASVQAHDCISAFRDKGRGFLDVLLEFRVARDSS